MVGKERARPVLVGLSGGLDSLVAAYLLRIQKRDLYAVLIAATPEDMQDEGERLFACHQSEARIAVVKKFCEHLQIPLTVVRPRDEFSDEVLDPWIAARVLGRRPRACQDCHALRMRVLFQKMQELNCGSMATGHYAKVVRSTPQSPVSVHSSNDMAADQAGLIAALPQSILSVLELPLSELQRKEVSKIAENFQLHPPAAALVFDHCLPAGDKLQAFLEKALPASLKRGGEVVELAKENVLAKHEGFWQHQIGSSWGTDKGTHKILVEARWKSHELLVAGPEHFRDQAVFLKNCQWGVETDFSVPIKGFIHHEGGLTDREVLVQPRTLGGAYVRVLEGEEEFPLGKSLTVFRRRGKNAKIIVTGEMHRLGRQWPTSHIKLEGKNGVEQGVLDKDFNF